MSTKGAHTQLDHPDCQECKRLAQGVAAQKLARLENQTMYAQADMSTEPGETEMLLACLGWLNNIRLRNKEAYLDAMPNNCLGVDAMRARLHQIENAALTN